MIKSTLMKVLFATIIITFISGCSSSRNIDTSEMQTSVLHSINVVSAKEMIQNNNPIILDVRTPEEFREGHLENSINIDVNADDFTKEIAHLDKNANYLVYCRSGRRSLLAIQVMKDQGFTNVTNMEGGYNAWKNLL